MSNEENEWEALPKNLTIPKDLKLTASGFAEESYAKDALNKLHTVLSVLSQTIDLANLDGVTVAFDYDEALASLDRGYSTNYKLTATKGVAVGVAMAPSVIRAGKIKTHLVLNANYALSILEEPGQETEFFSQALHLIAHECAHVEVTAAFDTCFPGVLLQKTHTDFLKNIRWQVILACWDEYAVCRIVGSIGYDPSGGYLETLIKVLKTTRSECFDSIIAYRTHADVSRVTTEVYGKLGDLLKFSSYYLGATTNSENPAMHPADLLSEGEFQWFGPFYNLLIEALTKIWVGFGNWTEQHEFERLGDLVEQMAESLGIYATYKTNGNLYFDIPFRIESMPKTN